MGLSLILVQAMEVASRWPARRFWPVIAVGVGVVATMWFLGIPRARARAESIQCASILSSLGLSALTYSLDFNESFATDLRAMSNELSTTKILICPSDRSRKFAPHFYELGASNVSYLYLAAGLTNQGTNALFRCPLHGHVVFSDGRIVRGDGTIQYGKYGKVP
jgi:hypothetical protein